VRSSVKVRDRRRRALRGLYPEAATGDDDSPEREEGVDMLLECERCGRTSVFQVPEGEMAASGSWQAPCSRCRKEGFGALPHLVSSKGRKGVMLIWKERLQP
jgi:hypothetical protein